MDSDARRPMVWFLVLFVVYMAVGVVLLDLDLVQRWFVTPWTRFNATASAGIVSLMGIDARASGTTVACGTAHLNIMEGCNGAHALLILIASVLAFPAPWGRRIAGVIAGAAAVLGFNLVRLVNLIVVARYYPARLELFHVYIWQTLIILIAFSLFLVWGTFFAEPEPSAVAVDSA